MTSKKENNPCIASGCPGACCQDIRFTSMTDVGMNVLTPPGTYLVEIPEDNIEFFSAVVGRRKSPPNSNPSGETTVYYTNRQDGRHSVLINGPCPNLQQDGSCGAYSRRPIQCIKFEFGSNDCAQGRARVGLGPVMISQTIKKRPDTPKR